MRPVHRDDWATILQAASTLGEPHRSALVLLLLSGLRIGDVLNMQRSAIREALKHGETVIVQKGGRERLWAPPAYAPLHHALRQLLAREGWSKIGDLWAGNQRTAANRIRKALAQVCRRAGVDYANPHRFRHAMATALNDAGVDPRTIQAVLGHANFATTTRYIQVTGRKQAEAAGKTLEAALPTKKPK